MLLYVCPQCGRWQDQSLTIALSQAMNVLSQAWSGRQPQTIPAFPECPEGHGAMTLIQPTDRLALRVDEEITMTDKATGIAMTIQPNTPESWRRAAIEMFTRNGEDERRSD